VSGTGGGYAAASPDAAPAAAAAAAPTVAPAASSSPVPAPKAYIGDFKDNTVTVLDTRTNRVLATIPVPARPPRPVVTPDGRKLFVSSDGASTVRVIDTPTDRVAASIEVGKSPHGLALTPDGRQVLAAVFDASQVAFIDVATDQVTGRVPVPNPHNIAISRDGRLAYVAAQQPGATALAILDVTGKSQVGSVPLEKTPRALNFSPDGTALYFTEAGLDAVQVL